MTRDPRCALSQELEAKQTLLDQRPRRIDPRGRNPHRVKAALDKLQARKRAAENRIELKRRLLAHTLHQIGLLRTPTATLTVMEASLRAIAIAAEDIPARWWKPQPTKLDQDGLTKSIRAREQALKEAEALTDPEERGPALAAIEALHPLIPGVTASNGGITLIRTRWCRTASRRQKRIRAKGMGTS